MKFKAKKTHRYWWPVTILVPSETDAGKFDEQTMKVQFEPLKRDASIAAGEVRLSLNTAREVADHEHEQLLMVVKNWDEVEDDERNPIPFSEAAFNEALQDSWFRNGVYAAYADSLNGVEAKVGNSRTRPATGLVAS